MTLAMNVRHPGDRRFVVHELLPNVFGIAIECDGLPIVTITLRDTSEEAARHIAEFLEREANLVMMPDIAEPHWEVVNAINAARVQDQG